MPSSSPWKECASCILIVDHSNAPSDHPASHSESILESQSVLAQSAPRGSTDSPQAADYRLLMVKRRNVSSYIESCYVFPNGELSLVDFSSRWWTVFSRLQVSADRLRDSILSRVNYRLSGDKSDASDSRQPLAPPIVRSNVTISQQDPDGSHLVDPLIALRIATIRNLFIETGMPAPLPP